LLFSLLICKTDVSSTGSQLSESSEQSLSRVWLDWYVPRMLDLLHRMQKHRNRCCDKISNISSFCYSSVCLQNNSYTVIEEILLQIKLLKQWIGVTQNSWESHPCCISNLPSGVKAQLSKPVIVRQENCYSIKYFIIDTQI
jgi:hypothetical protein